MAMPYDCAFAVTLPIIKQRKTTKIRIKYPFLLATYRQLWLFITLKAIQDVPEGSVITIVQVNVRDNNVEQALRVLKKKMQREGLFREMKDRRHFEKNSEKKKRTQAEAVRRARKEDRKRRERNGF
jgi:small subunit ribosomal protein S21